MKIQEAKDYLEKDFDDVCPPDPGILLDISSLLGEASEIICSKCKDKSEEKCSKCKWHYKVPENWFERI